MSTIDSGTTDALPGHREKVVYILGAGFSKPAGAPSQSEILSDMFRLENTVPRVKCAQAALREFLENDLRISPASVGTAALEDIYTPIDRCIADGISLKSKTALDLVKIWEQLEYLIAAPITRRISDYLRSNPGASDYINDFAKHIVMKVSKRAELAKNAQSADRAKEYDPISVISLN